MQGNMWVESEVSKGSKFFFTITSQISHSSMEPTPGKMAAFSKRTILVVDTLFDKMGVVEQIEPLHQRSKKNNGDVSQVLVLSDGFRLL